MTALVWLRHSRITERERSRYMGDFAAFQRWLTSLTVAHFDRVQAQVRGTLGTDPGPLIARLLVANEWLAGRTAPDEPLLAQWEVVWRTAPDAVATASTDARGERWRRLAESLRTRVPLLRERLPELLRVGQRPTDPIAGLIDGAVVLDAITEAQRAPVDWPDPDHEGTLAAGLRELVSVIVEAAEHVRELLSGAIEEEDADVRERAQRVDEVTAGVSIEELLRSARETVGDALDVHSRLLPPADEQRWNGLWRQLEDGGLALGGDALEALDDVVVSWAEARPDANAAEKLTRLAKVPRRHLQLIHQVTLAIDAAVDAVHREAARVVDSGDPAGQEQLEAAARQLIGAARKLYGAAGDEEVGDE